MSEVAERDDMFSAGSLGATISRNLLRSLALKDPDLAERLLAQSLKHPLFRFGFELVDQTEYLDDLQHYLSGTDTRLEYQHAKLTFRVLDQLNIKGGIPLLELFMRRAYAAGDAQSAHSTATELLERSETLPLSVLVSCRDVIGRILSDRQEFDAAAQSFLKGAESANRAGLDFEEWDQRTNLIWCLYAQEQHLEVLRQLDLSEPIARRMGKPHALVKTLIDRGNSELALGRFDVAQKAYLEALSVAEKSNDITRQSDALGNLGSIAFKNGDLVAAEGFHRRALALSRQINSPGSVQFDLNNLALALWKQGKAEAALEAIQEALEIAHQLQDLLSISKYQALSDQIRSSLGRSATAENRRKLKEDAVNANKLTTGVESAPSPEESEAVEVEKRVRAFLNQRDTASANKLVAEHLALRPHSARFLCLHGVLLANSGDIEGARRAYELALSHHPADMEAHSRLVDVNTHTNELENLLKRYQLLVRNDPFNPGVRVGLALILSRLGQHEDAIQNGLEAVRLASKDELAYMALAEAQRERCFYLLDNDWDAAWADFQDFAFTLDTLISTSQHQKGQWYALAATVFERFAMRSHFANPPLDLGMDTREITLLAMASHYCVEGMKFEPWRNFNEVGQRIDATLRALAKPEKISVAAGHLQADGRTTEALTLLILSLQLDPNQAEAKFQLAQIMSNGTESGRQAALEYIREAIKLDPNMAKYREAEVHFKKLRFPASDSTSSKDED